MNSTISGQTELKIWKELASKSLSISHDHWHIDRVLAFARQLQSVYGGDVDVITAAVLLHDLGRSEPELRGQASIEKSLEDAERILRNAGLADAQIRRVLRAIDEHDKPGVRPGAIEGRILKEADFLAGFGVWGVVRIAMWAAETNRGMPQVLDRLQQRMPRRFASLQFVESLPFAAREMLFANLCLTRLKEPAKLDGARRRGLYIVLEGISGSGKDTQADLLMPRLEQAGHTVVRVEEPTGRFRKARDDWGDGAEDPVVQMFLLFADRYQLVRDSVLPALARGDTVLSVRSFISTLVYQHQNVYDSAEIAFIHHFVPAPDLVLLYDLDAETALERCSGRAKWVLSDMGDNERKEALRMHRQLYLDAVRRIPTLEAVPIDATKPIEVVETETWRVVQPRIA